MMSHSLIPGLSMKLDFLSSHSESLFLPVLARSNVFGSSWSKVGPSANARKVLHFGYRYDYRRRQVGPDMYLGPLPPVFARMATRLVDEGIMSEIPDQVIVNRYLPGQGISAHIDCPPCFGPQIVTVSLGATWPMRFTRGGRRFDVLLPRCSAALLSGEARSHWRHEIVPNSLASSARYSFTFRNVFIEGAVRH